MVEIILVCESSTFSNLFQFSVWNTGIVTTVIFQLCHSRKWNFYKWYHGGKQCCCNVSLINKTSLLYWKKKRSWLRECLPISKYLELCGGFPDSSVGKESSCNAGDLGSIPGLERSPGEGKGYPLWYSGLENSMDCIIHGVTKSWTRLRDFQWSMWRSLENSLKLISSALQFNYYFNQVCMIHQALR